MNISYSSQLQVQNTSLEGAKKNSCMNPLMDAVSRLKEEQAEKENISESIVELQSDVAMMIEEKNAAELKLKIVMGAQVGLSECNEELKARLTKMTEEHNVASMNFKMMHKANENLRIRLKCLIDDQYHEVLQRSLNAVSAKLQIVALRNEELTSGANQMRREFDALSAKYKSAQAFKSEMEKTRAQLATTILEKWRISRELQDLKKHRDVELKQGATIWPKSCSQNLTSNS